MLFNSAEFLVGFLPIVLLRSFTLAGARRQPAAGAWPTLASLMFYGRCNPVHRGDSPSAAQQFCTEVSGQVLAKTDKVR